MAEALGLSGPRREGASVSEQDLTPEQREARDWAREFARRSVVPRALILDKDPESPERDAMVLEAAKAGIFGLALPEPMGGMGLDPVGSMLVTEELAAACAGCAVLFGASALGFSPILASFDMSLFDRFVRPIVESWSTEEPKHAALAATEPDMGSDFIQGHPQAHPRTRVTKRDGSYLINGTKVFISNGSLASMVTVFGSLDPSGPIRDNMICLAVPTDTAGFSVGQIFDKMGQRASPAAELVFDDVEVPEANRIGLDGGGWQINRLVMMLSRPAVGAIALGIARAAYEKAIEYAEARIQGGKAIVGHQAVQLMLADMAIRVEAARHLVHDASRSMARGQPDLKLSSMAKTFASDAAVANSIDAIQILGGYGYMHEYGVEKLLRDAKLTQIYEGTNQINRFEIMESVIASRA